MLSKTGDDMDCGPKVCVWTTDDAGSAGGGLRRPRRSRRWATMRRRIPSVSFFMFRPPPSPCSATWSLKAGENRPTRLTLARGESSRATLGARTLATPIHRRSTRAPSDVDGLRTRGSGGRGPRGLRAVPACMGKPHPGRAKVLARINEYGLPARWNEPGGRAEPAGAARRGAGAEGSRALGVARTSRSSSLASARPSPTSEGKCSSGGSS